MRLFKFLCVSLVLFFPSVTLAAPDTSPVVLTVGAAASLREALTAATAAFTKEHPEIKVDFNFAATSTIVRQIRAGASMDIFFSADEINMDHLEKEKALTPNSRRDILSNEMVMIVSAAAALKDVRSPDDLLLPVVKTLALCDDAVPIGHYSRRYLTALGIMNKLSAQIAKPDNVRGVLSLVQSHAADAGFVYKTDLEISDKRINFYQLPPSSNPAVLAALSIRYPAAILKSSVHQQESRALVEFLATSAVAKKVFLQFGFKML